jgi:DNA mismatch endonuclease (patch repair protein)
MTTPPASSDQVRRRMQATGRRDTPPERVIRQELHSRGLRYRVDRSIPGVTRSRPDIVFPSEKVAVYVDGCFWHSCPQHATVPKQNRDWWVAKLEDNCDRDRRHNAELQAAGWEVLRFWEHEDVREVTFQIVTRVLERRGSA